MYQFTREFIVNDNKGKLNGGHRFFLDKDVFKLQGGCNIRKQDVNAVYKAVGADEAVEHIVWTPTDAKNIIKAGDIIRLTIVLGQENRVHPLFNDYYPDHTQTFFYEAEADTDHTVPVAALNKAIAAEKNRFENVYFSANDNATTIDLTLMDCYTRLESIRLVVVHTNVDPTKVVASNLTAYEDWDVVEELKDRKAIVDAVANNEKGFASTTTALGSAGKFTTNYLVQNVRLLTDAAINPYGINKDERPLPRSVYNQYMVECISERRHIGHQVMGSIDHSLTTFVFFVLNDANLIQEFETALGGIGTINASKNAPVQQVVALKADVMANAAADVKVADVIDNTIAAVKGVHSDDPTVSALKNTKGK